MEQKVAEYIKETFSSLGIKVKIDEIGNVIIENEGVCESHIFHYVSHIDTVKPHIKAKIINDTIIGRGAVDAKGPLLSMIDAIYESKNACLKVLGLVGEEQDSRGARFIVEKNITLNNVIIGEPSNNNVCIGYRGRLLLELKCKGENKHVASLQKNNPIQTITNIVMNMERIIDLIGEDKIVATPTKVLSKGLSNVVPSEAKILYDLRFVDNEVLREVLLKIQNVLSENCTYREVSFLPPIEVKPSDILVQSLARSIIREGLSVNYIKKIGTSDMNILYNVSQHIVSFGPGDPKLSHTSKEKININDIITASRILQRVPLEYERVLRSRSI